MKRALAVVVGMFGLVAWSAPVAPPPPDVIPAAGATVGRNTKIWIFESGSGVTLFDSNAMEVITTLTTIAIPPFSAFEKLTPMTELRPGRYELRRYQEVVSTFTVIDELDTTPPPQAQVELTSVGKIGAMVSSVTLTGPTTNDTFLVLMGEPQMWEPASAYAVTSTGTAIAYDISAGPQRFKVVRVDAAGNAAEPLEVTTTVPKDRACSVAPVLPLSLLALALLRARRYR
jgi:hypothetical protein